MKILLVLVMSGFALLLGSCAADRPLMADEDYNALHPPAAYAPDPMSKIPQKSDRPSGL
jgi:hypothetical protein